MLDLCMLEVFGLLPTEYKYPSWQFLRAISTRAFTLRLTRVLPRVHLKPKWSVQRPQISTEGTGPANVDCNLLIYLESFWFSYNRPKHKAVIFQVTHARWNYEPHTSTGKTFVRTDNSR